MPIPEMTAMTYWPIVSILIEDRHRTHIDENKIAELREDILKNGLLHPIGLNYNSEKDNYYLIYGERRYRALRQIYSARKSFTYGDEKVKPPFVPVIIYKDLTEKQAYEIEITEI